VALVLVLVAIACDLFAAMITVVVLVGREPPCRPARRS
jgi:hypothetical protein